MEPSVWNHRNASEDFVMLGFSNQPEYEVFLFGLFLAMHLVTLSGHLSIVVVTLVEPTLCTPMYFFLRNLSSIEIFYTLVIVPKMLVNFLASSRKISLPACATQMYFFISLGTSECFLLAVMAYDRYVAICNPLRYTLIMNRALCLQLLVVVCATGFVLSLGLTALIFRLPFCGSHEINHFFCDIPPVLFLACSDTHTDEILVLVACVMALLVPFLLILVSYVFIANSILKIKCSQGRKKAFSTCAAHLVVAVLHYGCAIFIYIRPKASYSLEQDKVVSLIYTNVTPMLYPMIYSLRNKEVKGALRKVIGSKVSFQKNILSF
ncbi:olfactory receptor 10Q1-like [Heteronotia binoei]|uniref:olfactory receptor 10Q1-like n=1 Tax=Heteronotia binoei TaxID=13085 RepID=UPI00292E8FBE|nr:olfactory receptor 10Q1-like [Heteronotia binoei]